MQHDVTPEKHALMAVVAAFDKAGLMFDDATAKPWLENLRIARHEASNVDDLNRALGDEARFGEAGKRYVEYCGDHSLDLYDALRDVVGRVSDGEGMYGELRAAKSETEKSAEHVASSGESGHSDAYAEYDAERASLDQYYEQIAPGYLSLMQQNALALLMQNPPTAEMELDQQQALAAKLVSRRLENSRRAAQGEAHR